MQADSRKHYDRAGLKFWRAWEATVQNNAAVSGSGRYTFGRELNGHILARHSTSDENCSAPASFDCAHSDLFYVFPGESQLARDMYFDNEGHVIHYDVSTPKLESVVFCLPLDKVRDTGLRMNTDGVMTGKFQMQMRRRLAYLRSGAGVQIAIRRHRRELHARFPEYEPMRR